MAMKITLGTTQFEDLTEILGFEDGDLEERRARLFPLGNTQDEIQTTSIFLSSLAAVKEYREELLSQIGITKIRNRNVKLHVFTEISNEEKTERPDGMIVLTSGKKDPVIDWICFIEAKVKKNPLSSEQLEKYVEFGRKVGIHSIITISNDITTSPFDSPVSVKSLRNFDLYHWSWTYLKVMSTRLLKTDAIEDEDHVYILSELRRYFDNHRNVFNFTNMGAEWKDAIQTIHEEDHGKKPSASAIESVVDAYKQEEKDIALQLTDNTDYHIQLLLGKIEDRAESLKKSLMDDARIIHSRFFIEGDKKQTFTLHVDIPRKTISCSCDVVIDKGKAQGQTSTLLRMLAPASESDVTVAAFYPRNKSCPSMPLAELYHERDRQHPYSILDKQLGDTVKYFTVTIRKEIGRDMNGSRNFVTQVEQLCETFLLQIARYALLGEKVTK